MRGIALSLLQQTPYQTHEISAECSHPCVLNFIYYGLPFWLKKNKNKEKQI